MPTEGQQASTVASHCPKTGTPLRFSACSARPRERAPAHVEAPIKLGNRRTHQAPTHKYRSQCLRRSSSPPGSARTGPPPRRRCPPPPPGTRRGAPPCCAAPAAAGSAPASRLLRRREAGGRGARGEGRATAVPSALGAPPHLQAIPGPSLSRCKWQTAAQGPRFAFLSTLKHRPLQRRTRLGHRLIRKRAQLGGDWPGLGRLAGRLQRRERGAQRLAALVLQAGAAGWAGAGRCSAEGSRPAAAPASTQPARQRQEQPPRSHW